MPLISICIPAYKNTEFLERLLNSISIQNFKDYEIIVADDSPDNSIEYLLKKYQAFKISYYKNTTPLGTPANWNFAISKAKGEWIKLMHDDDWFADENSLSILVKHMSKDKKIIKSAYSNVHEDGKSETILMSMLWKSRMLKQPMSLMANNIIGPPSVLLIHSSIKEKYDERLKWRVDQEFYVRLLKSEQKFQYIKKPLIKVGISKDQVTNSCIHNPFVELPEGFILLQKHGVIPLKNIWVYDAWWRLLRNMQIVNTEQLNKYTQSTWPTAIIVMIKHLKIIPSFLLKIGIFSKLFMFLSYLSNFSNLNDNCDFNSSKNNA